MIEERDNGREFIRSIKRANLKLTLTIAKSKDNIHTYIYIYVYIFESERATFVEIIGL